jgi:hypothetical protein
MAETEEDAIEEAEMEEKEEANLPALPGTATPDLITTQQMRGIDHSKRMDDLFTETLDVARKIVDMGMNIDPSKAPRMFEVANQLFKTAQDSADSKREAELKLMQLIQTQQKIEIDRKRLTAELGEKGEISGEVIMVEDRNKLLQMLRQQKADETKSGDSE